MPTSRDKLARSRAPALCVKKESLVAKSKLLQLDFLFYTHCLLLSRTLVEYVVTDDNSVSTIVSSKVG